MIVYLVKGHTGEYDDRYEWIAHAFISKERAEDTMAGLNLLVEGTNKLSLKDRDSLLTKIVESFDPKCSIDYTGTYYNIEEIEVRE